MSSTILQKAVNTNARAKVGFLGFGGSGKTTTAAFLAAGLAQLPGAKKVVAMFDTENGSDFLIPIFEGAGIQFLRVKSRSFKDLIQFGKEVQGVADVALVDSVTHVWRDLVQGYQRRLKRVRLSFRDWGPIKDEWAAFTDWYVDCPVHAIVCGRAGYEFDEVEDDDGNGKTLQKTGIKMKAEGEMGFEPSLLVEMQRVSKGAITKDAATHGWVHQAIVLKDRAMRMDGVVIDDPTFESFRPHLEALNLTGEHEGTAPKSDTADLFETGDSRSLRRKQVEITLELIEAEFVAHDLSGQKAENKKKVLDLLQEHFQTRSWTAVTNMSLEDLQDGLERLREALNGPAPLPPRPTAPPPPPPAPAPAAATQEEADRGDALQSARAKVYAALTADDTPEDVKDRYRPMYDALMGSADATENDYLSVLNLVEGAVRKAKVRAGKAAFAAPVA